MGNEILFNAAKIHKRAINVVYNVCTIFQVYTVCFNTAVHNYLRANKLLQNLTGQFCHPQQVVAAIRAGVNPSGHPSNEASMWDFSSSFFFAGTVITTIGNSFTLIFISMIPSQ